MRNTLSRFNPDDSPRPKGFACKTHGATSPTIACAQVRRNRKSQSNFLTSLLALFLIAGSAFGQHPQLQSDEDFSERSTSQNEFRSSDQSGLSRVLSNDGKLTSRVFWVDAEYLLVSIDRYSIPSLVTSSPVGTPLSNAGVLPNSTSLLDTEYGKASQSGFKFGVGGWLDRNQESGFEVNFFGLPSHSERHTFDSNQFPILARPVFDSTLDREAASLISYPNVLRGNLSVIGSTDLQMVDALFRERWAKGPSSQVDVVFGYQYAGLHERLAIDQFSQYLSGQGPILVGTTKQISDQFETRNQFHGGVFGLDYRERIGQSIFSIRPGLAFGMNETKVDIRGNTTNTVPGGGSANFAGGLLAQSTNIGSYSDRKMIVIPELTVRLQTQLCSNWQISVGYNLHYWSNAVRPGSQIDRMVSQYPPETPVGDRHPLFPFQKEGVLIHGLQTGLVFSF